MLNACSVFFSWLFYCQPASGLTYRIPTPYLNDALFSSLAGKLPNSPTTGGTAMDADGTTYLNDRNLKRMLKITADGRSSVFLQDGRLIWGNATMIDSDGYIWIPTPQINRTLEFQKDVSTVEYLVKLYKLKST